MSLFRSMNLRCPSCGTEISVSVAGSINADRRPDRRLAILANDFQDATCGSCGTSFRCESDLNYIDMARGQWIAALPARLMADHLEEEERALIAYDESFGPKTSAIAQDIGRGLTVRVVFGWSAFREKLLLGELGIDDVALECMKVDLMRRLPEAPLRPGVELRLDRIEAGRMNLIWIDALSEDVIEELSLDRALLDSIIAAPDAWGPLRTDLTLGPFVDMQRLFMGPGRATAIGPQAL